MKDKYYTPSIDEFYIGFECEFRNKLTSLSWKKTICEIEDILLAHASSEQGDIKYQDNMEESFRVKYLNEADLIKLDMVGVFPRLVGNIKYIEGKFKVAKKGGYIQAIYNTDTKLMSLFIGGDFIFIGIVKNKSELKKLIVQLRVM